MGLRERLLSHSPEPPQAKREPPIPDTPPFRASPTLGRTASSPPTYVASWGRAPARPPSVSVHLGHRRRPVRRVATTAINVVSCLSGTDVRPGWSEERMGSSERTSGHPSSAGGRRLAISVSVWGVRHRITRWRARLMRRCAAVKRRRTKVAHAYHAPSRPSLTVAEMSCKAYSNRRLGGCAEPQEEVVVSRHRAIAGGKGASCERVETSTGAGARSTWSDPHAQACSIAGRRHPKFEPRPGLLRSVSRLEADTPLLAIR